MKVLYAIQGTGNGHVSRATEIIPLLSELAETDVLVSGIQADLDLPFAVKYRFYGMSFIFGKKGGVDLWKTIVKSKPLRLLSDICSLPVKEYDLIINDFEPVSAWACKLKGKPCVGLSHQNAVLNPEAPAPEKHDFTGSFILKKYAPSTVQYGFHFKQIGERIFTPVIRKDIREAQTENDGHYTVYLPAYSDREIIGTLGKLGNISWEVFSKHTSTDYEAGNIKIRKVSADGFTKSFLSCDGILCTAGFETPAEALYLGKKLCVIPMKGQYEQQCNAAFLKSMGVTVLNQLPGNENHIRIWVEETSLIQVNYPNLTKAILEMVLSRQVADSV